MNSIVLLLSCAVFASAAQADCAKYAADEKARAGRGLGDAKYQKALHACQAAERDQKVYDSLPPDQRKRFARRVLPRR